MKKAAPADVIPIVQAGNTQQDFDHCIILQYYIGGINAIEQYNVMKLFTLCYVGKMGWRYNNSVHIFP